jgi:hypothetical protein
VDDHLGRHRVRLELAGVHPEDGEALGSVDEVGDPRRHEVEHLAVHAEFGVEGADRGDRGVVDVGDEPVRPVEGDVGGPVLAVEEPVREGHAHPNGSTR